MVCKPINQVNFKLDEMYDAIVWVIMTVRQASVFDAKNFCHHISQLTQLINGNIPHPERFNQMIHIEQGEESMLHIILNFWEFIKREYYTFSLLDFVFWINYFLYELNLEGTYDICCWNCDDIANGVVSIEFR